MLDIGINTACRLTAPSSTNVMMTLFAHTAWSEASLAELHG